jgi:hypothetical protein
MHDVVAWLQSRPRLVRAVMLQFERSPTRLYKEVQRMGRPTAGPSEGFEGLSTDPFELLKELEVVTERGLTPDDFLPLTVGRVIEPLMEVVSLVKPTVVPRSYSNLVSCVLFECSQMLRFGRMSIRPPGMCGFFTILLNTEEYKVGVGSWMRDFVASLTCGCHCAVRPNHAVV